MKRTCWNCKKPLRVWELLCSQCAELASAGPDSVVVITGPALRYRLVNYVRLVLSGVVAVALARFLMGSLSFALGGLFGDVGESVGTAISLLTMLAAVLWCFGAVVAGWDDVRSRALYEVSKRAAKYSNVIGTDLHDYQLALADVISLKVAQTRVGHCLDYGDLIFTTSEQTEALAFRGIAQPYAVKERVDDLLRTAVPIAAGTSPLPKGTVTSQPNPARKLAWVTPALIIVAIVALLAWLIMPPTIDVHAGESRNVFLEADYVVTHGDIGWVDADTQNINIDVGAPDTIRVFVDSIKATINKIGEGQSIGFQYTARIQVAPQASSGEASVYIRITHPKLMGPSVSQPPIRKIRVRIKGAPPTGQ